jgi:FMN-dependent NADH-azoreductase
VDAWRAQWPDDQVTYRDVGLHPPPMVDEGWIAACLTTPTARDATMRAALAASDVLIAELVPADVIVIGTPLYNCGMPANLKAWFDQVIRMATPSPSIPRAAIGPSSRFCRGRRSCC